MSILRTLKSILHGCLFPGVHSFDEISAAKLGFDKFSCSSEVNFSYFFLSSLFYVVCFQYSQVFVIFLLSGHSNASLIS